MINFKLCFFLILLVLSCTPAYKGNSSEKQQKYEVIAREKYKGAIDYVFNDSSSHVLCINSAKPDASNPRKTTRFFIYDLVSDSLIYEDSMTDGSVKWINNDQIEIITKIGLITPDKESNLIRNLYDIRLYRKMNDAIQERKDQ